MCSQMARPPWGAQQLARWPGTSPVSRPEKLGSRARFQNTAVFLWHSPASEVTKCDWGGRFSLLCMQQILSPLPPFPTAIHKGVFVLCKFKVSSSNGEKRAGPAITRRRPSFTGCQTGHVGGVRVSAGPERGLQMQREWFPRV